MLLDILLKHSEVCVAVQVCPKIGAAIPVYGNSYENYDQPWDFGRVFSIFRDKARNLQVGRGVFGESQENFFLGRFMLIWPKKRWFICRYLVIICYNMRVKTGHIPTFGGFRFLPYIYINPLITSTAQRFTIGLWNYEALTKIVQPAMLAGHL